jgi:O-6-methylguanine DNA methyltransferase
MPTSNSNDFKTRVCAVVAKIPKGKTLSYKQVAALAGNPKAYRAVGNLMHKNKNPEVPCHRVIKSDGSPAGKIFPHITRR